MISNASPRRSELRPSRPSITVLRPSAPVSTASNLPELRASLATPARRHALGELWDTVRMAVGLDDDREDYECAS